MNAANDHGLTLLHGRVVVAVVGALADHDDGLIETALLDEQSGQPPGCGVLASVRQLTQNGFCPLRRPRRSALSANCHESSSWWYVTRACHIGSGSAIVRRGSTLGLPPVPV